MPPVATLSNSVHRRRKKGSYARPLHLKYSLHHVHGWSSSPDHSSVSSGSETSSPSSSFGSVTLSSQTSRSTQSPPSSHSSLADLSAPSPLHFSRPQPRIQVSSLLAETRTRCVMNALELRHKNVGAQGSLGVTIWKLYNIPCGPRNLGRLTYPECLLALRLLRNSLSETRRVTQSFRRIFETS